MSFLMWCAQFKLYRVLMEFVDMLDETTAKAELRATEADVLDPNDASDKKKIGAKRANARAMAAFTIAFQTPKMMKFVYAANTTDWPKGLAYLVAQALEKKYMPKDVFTAVEAQSML